MQDRVEVLEREITDYGKNYFDDMPKGLSADEVAKLCK